MCVQKRLREAFDEQHRELCDIYSSLLMNCEVGSAHFTLAACTLSAVHCRRYTGWFCTLYKPGPASDVQVRDNLRGMVYGDSPIQPIFQGVMSAVADEDRAIIEMHTTLQATKAAQQEVAAARASLEFARDMQHRTALTQACAMNSELEECMVRTANEATAFCQAQEARFNAKDLAVRAAGEALMAATTTAGIAKAAREKAFECPTPEALKTSIFNRAVTAMVKVRRLPLAASATATVAIAAATVAIAAAAAASPSCQVQTSVASLCGMQGLVEEKRAAAA